MLNTNNEDYAFVYKKAYAMKLIAKGHQLFTTMPNPYKPNFIVWVFIKTAAFNNDFEALIREGSRNE